MNEIKTHIFIAENSLGGCIATLQSLKLGKTVILYRRNLWHGGQLSSQMVPADEYNQIEEIPLSLSYTNYRIYIRNKYLNDDMYEHTASQDLVDNDQLNPGNGWVSRLCHLPQDAHEYFLTEFSPYVSQGKLRIIENLKLIDKIYSNKQLQTLIFSLNNNIIKIQAEYYLDSSEEGYLIKFLNIPYTIGKESRLNTGEEQAPLEGNFADQQPISLVFALSYNPNKNYSIAKPKNYEFWYKYKAPKTNFNLLSLKLPPQGNSLPFMAQDTKKSWWTYRRCVDSQRNHNFKHDITLINMPATDYYESAYINGRYSIKEIYEYASNLNECFLYWLQNNCTDAHNNPLKGLKFEPTIAGTKTGNAQGIYVRETRRIIGLETLTYNDITKSNTSEPHNSVGFNGYPIDSHPTLVSGSNCFGEAKLYSIPLGCFVQTTINNLLPTNKNISMTHLANCSVRTHTGEWAIGEASAIIASYCIDNNLTPAKIYSSLTRTKELQKLLIAMGVNLHKTKV